MAMVENNQESQGFDAGAQPEASGDKQSMLLKLAERTVVEAEALAQEIIDHARQESEAAGDKILADASEKAKADTQQTIGNAKRRSEKTLSNARSESRRLLSKAQSDIEKLISEAKDEVEKIVSEARFAHEANLGAAHNEVQEILGKA